MLFFAHNITIQNFLRTMLHMSIRRLLSPPRCNIIIKDCIAIIDICNFKDHMYWFIFAQAPLLLRFSWRWSESSATTSSPRSWDHRPSWGRYTCCFCWYLWWFVMIFLRQSLMFSHDRSASFNLLAISAVCIAGVPTNEIRRIKAFPVFIITSFFSIFAYLWIVIVLVVSSPVDKSWQTLFR